MEHGWSLVWRLEAEHKVLLTLLKHLKDRGRRLALLGLLFHLDVSFLEHGSIDDL